MSFWLLFHILIAFINSVPILKWVPIFQWSHFSIETTTLHSMKIHRKMSLWNKNMFQKRFLTNYQAVLSLSLISRQTCIIKWCNEWFFVGKLFRIDASLYLFNGRLFIHLAIDVIISKQRTKTKTKPNNRKKLIYIYIFTLSLLYQFFFLFLFH